MYADELDLAEREDLLTQPAPSDALDVRDVAQSGAPLLAYLKFLMVGPLGIGALAIASSASTPWEGLPVTTPSTSSHSEGVAFPENLLVGAITTPAQQQPVNEGAAAPGRRTIPMLKVSIYKPEIADIQFELAQPEANLDAQPNPNILPAAPQAPTLVTVE
jgi:hypothetical protein